jgi:cell division transport system permease protein
MPMAAPAGRRLLDAGRQTRSMAWIMAIMLFLTVLAGAFGLAALAAAQALDRQLAGRLTVQIVEANPDARERATAATLSRVRAVPGVARAAPVDRAALAAMLRPWLGEQGADSDLPIPAMIDIELRAPSDAAVAAVTRAVQVAAPGARIDRYESWMSPVASFMRVMIGLAIALILLMAAATATVVVLAARAGLDSHRETIEVLHMLGSTDSQIARLFQRRIALDTLFGGLAGTLIALVAIGFVGVQVAGLGSDLLGGIAFGVRDWVLLIALPIAFALLATVAARLAVMRALQRYL